MAVDPKRPDVVDPDVATRLAGRLAGRVGVAKMPTRTAGSWATATPHVIVWFYSAGDPKPVTEVTVEVARSPAKRAEGLQGRDQLHPAAGMLFLPEVK